MTGKKSGLKIQKIFGILPLNAEAKNLNLKAQISYLSWSFTWLAILSFFNVSKLIYFILIEKVVSVSHNMKI